MTIHELQAIIQLADREHQNGSYQEAERIAKDALIPLQFPTDSISHSRSTIYSELSQRAVSVGTGRDLSLQPQSSFTSLSSFQSFRFVERGTIDIKGKGTMKTYFLERL